MLLPIIIVVACFATGAVASARWLPPLPDGLLGGVAFLLVCGLLAASLSLVGLNIYSIVNALQRQFGSDVAESIVAVDGLRELLYEGGVTAGLAGIIYMLALRRSPSRQATDEQRSFARHSGARDD